MTTGIRGVRPRCLETDHICDRSATPLSASSSGRRRFSYGEIPPRHFAL
jgi:hypothetical protein